MISLSPQNIFLNAFKHNFTVRFLIIQLGGEKERNIDLISVTLNILLRSIKAFMLNRVYKISLINIFSLHKRRKLFSLQLDVDSSFSYQKQKIIKLINFYALISSKFIHKNDVDKCGIKFFVYSWKTDLAQRILIAIKSTYIKRNQCFHCYHQVFIL